nr:hypothetical protein [Nonomuraea basaltis]
MFDRAVELPDRLVAVALRRSAGRRRLLDPQEHLQRFRAEGHQRQLQGAIAVRQGPGMRRQHPRRVQPRAAADSVEQIRGQRQVQHLLGEDAAHHLDGFRVALRVERVQRAQVRRQGRVFQFDRPLQVLAKAFERVDPRRRTRSRRPPSCRASDAGKGVFHRRQMGPAG